MTTTTPASLLESLAAGEGHPRLPLFLAGEMVEAADGATYTTYAPATGEPWAEVAEAGPEDVDRAVRAGRRALDGPWGATLAADRARILWAIGGLFDRHRELLARIESRDNGKAIRETRAEIDGIVRYFEFYAGVCQNLLGETMPATGPFFTYTRREPVGVVGAIIPWNSPLNMIAWKLAPALAGGNVVVLKPADETPVSALALATLLSELDLPPGVLSVLPGIGARAGQALVDHPGVDKIAFTGSTETGKLIAARAASTMKLTTFELGGKSPNIVFPDADLEAAARRSTYGIFSAAAVWTQDVRRAHRVAHQLRAGTVWVNNYRVLNWLMPFGGYKESGHGREGGIHAMEHYTQVKSVWVDLQDDIPDPYAR